MESRELAARRSLRTVWLAAFLSGAAALGYEALWSRLALFHFGADAPADLAVLAAVMGGLGAGALWFDRRFAAASPRRALRVYAFAELAAAGLALLVPTLLGVVSSSLAGLGIEGTALTLARVLGAIVLLGPGAMLLGVSLPALISGARGLAPRAASLERRTYALNVAGGVLGGLLFSVFLMPRIGARWSLLCACASGVCAALLALTAGPFAALDQLESASQMPKDEAGDERPSRVGISDRAALALILVAGFAGARTLGLEVIATRLLRLSFGGGVQAFALMLVVFLSGLAIGAALANIPPRRRLVEMALWAELCGLGATLVACALVPTLQQRFVSAWEEGLGASGLLMARLVVSSVLLWPLAIPIGVTLPALLGAVSGAERPRMVARLYGWNALGAVIGAGVTTFGLVPTVGLRGSLLGWGALCASSASVLALTLGWRRRAGLMLCAPLVLFAAPDWSPLALTEGRYALPTEARGAAGAARLVFYREGLTAVVSVEDHPARNSRILKTDGKIEGAVPLRADRPSEANLSTALALAAFPAVLAEELERACVIGLGTGVTLGAVLSYDFGAVDLCEIEPAVLEAVADPGELFALSNQRPLEDPRLSAHIIDAAAFLRGRRARYDLVTSQPSDPWLSASSLLLTRDFYALARGALKPGGVFCQWLQLYALDRAGLAAAIATFLDVFPDAVAFNPPGSGEVLLIGGHARFSPLRLAARLRARGTRDRGTVTAGVEQLLSCFVSGPKGLTAFSLGAPIETVDRPLLAARATELLGVPLARAGGLLTSLSERAGELYELLDGDDAERRAWLRDAAETAALRGQLDLARSQLRACVARGDDPEAERLLGDVAFRRATSSSAASGQLEEAERRWKRALALRPGLVSARLSLASYEVNRGRLAAAMQILELGVAAAPARAGPLKLLLGRLYQGKGDFARAYQLYLEAGDTPSARARAKEVRELAEHSGKALPETFGPRARDFELLIKAGRKRIREQRFGEAVSLLRLALKDRDGDARAWLELARAYRGLELLDESLEAIERSAQRGGPSLELRRLRATIFLAQGRPAEAERELLAALAASPREALSRGRDLLELARARLARGAPLEALESLTEAARSLPGSVLVELLSGDACAAAGQSERALARYRAFLEGAPRSHPERERVLSWVAKQRRSRRD